MQYVLTVSSSERTLGIVTRSVEPDSGDAAGTMTSLAGGVGTGPVYSW